MKNIVKALSNFLGWNTNRKIVVIESDDWGSIRMPSLSVYKELQSLGVNINNGDNERYNKLDTLASNNDFDLLFSTLRKHRDYKGNHPVFTAMALSANPDFEKIAQDRFAVYHFEPLTSTLKRYQKEEVFQMWGQGEREKLFYPEFHGREHLNIKIWMDDLRSSNEDTMEAFKRGFWGFLPKNKSGISYQAAFDLDLKTTICVQKEVIKSGLKLFENLHGRKASYFVPPNGLINNEIVEYGVRHGIKYVCSPKINKVPQGEGKTKRRFCYLGKKGYGEMLYLTRNCFFEPSFKGKGFSNSDCLYHIESAFTFRKPAIISTHRVNYIGGLNSQNRKDGNQALNRLLTDILKKWPDVEFMTSAELGKLIRRDKNIIRNLKKD